MVCFYVNNKSFSIIIKSRNHVISRGNDIVRILHLLYFITPISFHATSFAGRPGRCDREIKSGSGVISPPFSVVDIQSGAFNCTWTLRGGQIQLTLFYTHMMYDPDCSRGRLQVSTSRKLVHAIYTEKKL